MLCCQISYINAFAKKRISGEAFDPVAASAFAKLRTVYPYLTKANLSHYSPQQLMSDKEVSLLLGGQQVIDETDARVFHEKLKSFVDSGEKTEDESRTPTRRLWPLIKRVRVFIRHDVLADGVTLVDLPGGHDANAARAKIAEEYAVNCSGYLVVSQINRAADNGFAKALVDTTFRRQLSMDSGFFKNIITFVCTKSDDLSFPDSIEAFPGELRASLENLEALELRSKTDRLDDEMRVLQQKILKIRDDAEEDEDERDKLEDMLQHLQDKNSITVSPESDKYSLAQVLDQLNNISVRKKAGKKMRQTFSERLDAIKLEKSAAIQDLEQAKVELDVQCIAVRSRFSEGAVKMEFITEIAQIDQELAFKTNEDDFDPEEAVRDYEELRSKVSVFSISARAYQALSRSSADAEKIRGFPTLEHTNLPQLQQHCRDFAAKARATSCDQFLTSLSELLNSLVLWSGHSGSSADLDPEKIEELQEECKSDLCNL